MKKEKIYHFIGIGGVSMSTLAIFLKEKDLCVQGSDSAISSTTKHLKKLGITVFNKHSEDNVKNCNIAIITGAIKNDNVELMYCKKHKIPVITRGELLGLIAKEYKNVIAVSGAHGKTTTSSMITTILQKANLHPTAHIGGIMKEYNSSYLLGQKDYFVTEACEYKDSFLELEPTIGVILNVEKEHLDYFKTFENVKKSFHKFAENSKTVICHSSLENEYENAIYFGDSGYNARHIKFKKNRTQFVIYNKNKKWGKIIMPPTITHNIENALCSIAVCDLLKIKKKDIKLGLNSYQGVFRRFEKISASPYIIHDYAHHPTEIKCAIESLRLYHKGKIVVIFQPHTYSRTKNLMNEFCDVLSIADEVIIEKTYPAREKKLNGGTAKDLYNELAKQKRCVQYHSSFFETKKFIENTDKKNTAFLILGAGDIEKLAYSFKK